MTTSEKTDQAVWRYGIISRLLHRNEEDSTLENELTVNLFPAGALNLILDYCEPRLIIIADPDFYHCGLLQLLTFTMT